MTAASVPLKHTTTIRVPPSRMRWSARGNVIASPSQSKVVARPVRMRWQEG